jgi:signal transduction histidine kinase
MEKLLSERARLTQAERVTAWREMARRAAHDFDAVLMRLEAATVLSEALGSAGVRGEGAMLRESLEAMRGVENRLREFGDLLVLPMQTVRLNEIVRTVVRDFEPLFSNPLTEVTRPPIHPEVALAEDLPAILGDPTLLTRAIDLLLLFAVNSMPAGGSFTLRTFPTATLVHLDISWFGSAPAREESDRAFTPGGIDRRYSTGLELATVQSIISDHAGSLSVTSSEGYNHLRVQFPAAPAQAHSPELSADASQAGGADTQR